MKNQEKAVKAMEKKNLIVMITISALIQITSSYYLIWAKTLQFHKKVDVSALQTQLKSAGYAVDFIECSVDNCTIHMPDSEKKDPMPIVKKYVYVDPFEVRRKNLETMRALYAKWDAGTITNEEKDQLLKLFIGLNLGLLR